MSRSGMIGMMKSKRRLILSTSTVHKLDASAAAAIGKPTHQGTTCKKDGGCALREVPLAPAL
jgi:hypothetical protein